MNSDTRPDQVRRARAGDIGEGSALESRLVWLVRPTFSRVQRLPRRNPPPYRRLQARFISTLYIGSGMKETRRMRSTALAASVLALAGGLTLAGFSLAQPMVRAPAHAGGEGDDSAGSLGIRLHGSPASRQQREQVPQARRGRAVLARHLHQALSLRLHDQCRPGRQDPAEGHVDRQEGPRLAGDGRGAYTPESFKMNIHLKTISGMNLAGVDDAKRIAAECPAEERVGRRLERRPRNEVAPRSETNLWLIDFKLQ
jgi:hypothetical protein